jgi:hypothetical protein
MSISHPRIEVKDATAAGWFGAREEADLPARGDDGRNTGVAESRDATAGGAGRVWLRRLRRALVDLAMVVAAMTAVPLLTVSAVHGRFWQSRYRVHYAQAHVEEIETARAFMVPADPTITPLEAGQSYFYLLQPAVSTDFPAPSVAQSPPRTALGNMFYRSAVPGRRRMPNTSEILEAAAAGFSPEELAFLKTLSTAPVWREFDRAARAPVVDVVGGRFLLPFQPGASVWNMPLVQSGGLQSLAVIAYSRAAYHLAIGQRDSAEAVLRSIISLGVRVTDNAPTISDQFAGRELMTAGMWGLKQYYVLTHDPRAAAVNAGLSHGEPVGRGDFGSLPTRDAATPEQARSELIRRASDPHESRGVRFASLELLSLAPCSNVRELLLGPRADIRDAFERAKRDLARYPSERAFIDLIAQSPNASSLSFDNVTSPTQQFMVGAATIAGAVLHNPRLTGCTLLVTR